jgi:hypothetical protein
MIEDIIFIGNKNNPFYMIEFNKNKKKIVIYKPDKYSLQLDDFFEQYSLGEIICEIKYTKYYYMRKNCKQYLDKNTYLLSEILIETSNKYLLVKDKVYENVKLS